MRVKRLILPTLTMVIIASQLMGCAATSQSELLKMLNEGQQIEIEIAVPTFAEQGEEQAISWTQLDQLTTYSDFRSQMDDLMKISPFGEGSKTGIAYVNLQNQQEGNNTLFNAMLNRKFIANFYENESVYLNLQQYVPSLYADVEENSVLPAAINAYWNLLPDSTPNYFNGGATLTRLEVMSLLARATTPVTEEFGDEAFSSAVGGGDYADFASLVVDDSYLDTESKSLDNLTANGTITRGEYIYMLVSNIFGQDRMASADIKTASFSDCKDGGDIATAQKFIEDGTAKDMYQSYELTYALQNPDDGCPTKMYRALVSAQELGFLSSETRWDEGLTKEEAIQLFCDAMQSYAKLNGYPVDTAGGDLKPVTEIDGYQVSQDEGTTEESFTVTDMDVTMVVNVEAFTYETPSNEGLRVGAAQKDELVHVIGQVDGTNWFKIEQGNGETDDIIVSFIDGEFLSEYTAPAEETPAETTQPETSAETQQPSDGQPSGGNGGSGGNGNSGSSGGGSSQPTEPTPPPAQDEPQWNVGDVMGENESGANDMIYGGEFDPSQW